MANNINHRGNAYTVKMYQKCLLNHASEGPVELLDACQCPQSFHPRVEVILPQGSIDVLADNSPTFSEISTANSKHQTQGGQKRARLTPVVPDIKPPSGREEGMGSKPKPPESKKRLTSAQSERLEDVARRNNWKMFREYSKDEVAEICSEIGIEKRSLKAWVAYYRNARAIKKVASK